MNHCASWAGSNVSATCLKKRGSTKQNAEYPLQTFCSLEGAERAPHGCGSPAVASTEQKEQSAGVKFWASFWLETLREKGRGYTAKVFPVYTGRGIFNKQVINSFQSQKRKSQAVCFLCLKSKLHFHPHLYHYTPCQKIRVVIDLSTWSIKSQNSKPVLSCHALLETARNVMPSASDELWNVDLKKL